MWRLLYWGLDMCFGREICVFSHLAEHRDTRHSAVRRIMITREAAATRALLTYDNTSCNAQTVCAAEGRIIITIIRSVTRNTHKAEREKKKVRVPPWTFISHYHWLPVSFTSSFKANISGNLSHIAQGKVARGNVKNDLKRVFFTFKSRSSTVIDRGDGDLVYKCVWIECVHWKYNQKTSRRV